MSAVLSLAGKDLRLLLRDKAGFFFAFVWPLAMAILFGLMFSGGGGTNAIPVAVVDEDATAASKALVAALAGGDEIEVTLADTRDAANDLVRRGKRVAFLAIPRGYGETADRMFGASTRLVLGLDPARKAEGGMLQGVLTRYVMDRKTKSLPEAARTASPVTFERADVVTRREGPPNAFAYTFPQGILWAILGAAAAFGISLVSERTKGTLVRLVMAPIPRRHVLLGKALACLATTLCVSALLMVVAVAVFGVRVGSVPLLALALLSAGIGFVGLMMLLATVARTEAAAGGIGWAVLVVMSMFGGGMVPLFVMPPWMVAVGNASPVKWGILAVEGAVWRDFSLAEMALPCGILVAIGVLGFAIGVRAFRWSDR